MAGAVFLFPWAIQKTDFRRLISYGLSVGVEKASPAYAALEDLRENFPKPEAPSARYIRLATGTRLDIRALRQATSTRQIHLTGMTIRAPAAAEPAMVLPPVPVQLASAIARGVDVDDWRTPAPTVKALAQQLVEQELHRDPDALVQGSGFQFPVAAVGSSGAPAPQPQPFVPTLATVQPISDQMRPVWLQGQVEMTGGLAYVGPETLLTVRRMIDGQTLEKGRVWITEGRFEIHVNRPVGLLVAELQTRDGRLIGRGELNLLDLGEIPRRNNRVENIRLALRPFESVAAVRTVSGHSHGQQTFAVAKAKVEIERFQEPVAVSEEGFAPKPALDESSSFLVRAQADKHWPSLMVVHSGAAHNVRLYSEKMVEALVGLNVSRLDRSDALAKAIVWGQVRREDSSLAGLQVEMAGQGQAIYFNEFYLPDPQLKATSKNGLFAFVNVQGNIQALRLRDVAGRLYPAHVFPSEPKHVSYVDLEVTDNAITHFRVMSMRNWAQPVKATLRMVGSDEVLGVTGDEFVTYPAASNVSLVEADAGPEYEVSRVTVGRATETAAIPLVPRDWLKQIVAQLGVMIHPQLGMVVGFVERQNYQVELTGTGLYQPLQVIYFDAQGNILEGANQGVAGGGFIIFNAPVGFQTLYIHPEQGRISHAEVVVAEPGVVHVVSSP